MEVEGVGCVREEEWEYDILRGGGGEGGGAGRGGKRVERDKNEKRKLVDLPE